MKGINILVIFLLAATSNSFSQVAVYPNDSIKVFNSKKEGSIITIANDTLTIPQLILRMKDVNDFELNYYLKKYKHKTTLSECFIYTGAGLIGPGIFSNQFDSNEKNNLLFAGITSAGIGFMYSSRMGYFIHSAIDRYNSLVNQDGRNIWH